MSSEKFFSLNDLQQLQSMEGKILQEVIYFVWVNRINKNQPLVFIDKLQLKFSDQAIITLTAGEESDALHFLTDFDPVAEAVEMEERFNGEISLKAHHANNDKFWSTVIQHPIRSVRLSKRNDEYLSDAFILDFESESRLIGVSPEEGILIDFHEDV